jgi:hypothetical protein
MAHNLQEAYAVSLRRSLHIANVVPSIWYYKKRDRGDILLRMRMKEIAAVRVYVFNSRALFYWVTLWVSLDKRLRKAKSGKSRSKTEKQIPPLPF